MMQRGPCRCPARSRPRSRRGSAAWVVLGQEAPLHAGREARAAAAAQVGLLDRLDDLVRRQRQVLLQVRVAAALPCRRRSRPSSPSRRCAGGSSRPGSSASRRGGSAVSPARTRSRSLRSRVLEPLAVHLHRGRAAAGGQALHAVHREAAVRRGLALARCRASGRSRSISSSAPRERAGEVRADLEWRLPLRLEAEHRVVAGGVVDLGGREVEQRAPRTRGRRVREPALLLLHEVQRGQQRRALDRIARQDLVEAAPCSPG